MLNLQVYFLYAFNLYFSVRERFSPVSGCGRVHSDLCWSGSVSGQIKLCLSMQWLRDLLPPLHLHMSIRPGYFIAVSIYLYFIFQHAVVENKILYVFLIKFILGSYFNEQNRKNPFLNLISESFGSRRRSSHLVRALSSCGPIHVEKQPAGGLLVSNCECRFDQRQNPDRQSVIRYRCESSRCHGDRRRTSKRLDCEWRDVTTG